MGDRGNIKFTSGENHAPIYLYAHWHGYKLPIMLRDALDAGRGRWGDDSYITRICVSRMVGAAGDHDSETGWGLSTYETDNEYPITECDVEGSTVTINTHTWTFEQFCQLTDMEIRSAYRE